VDVARLGKMRSEVDCFRLHTVQAERSSGTSCTAGPNSLVFENNRILECDAINVDSSIRTDA
jgi:hypothetical protein